MKHCRNLSNRSVLLTYQLRRCDEVSSWSRTLKLVTKLGQFLLGTKAVHFSQTSSGSVSLRYQVVSRYNISKTSVLFSYKLRPLCDVLSWSVSLRYQVVRCYDVSNWLYLSSYQWDIAKTSQIGPSHSRTSCDVMLTSQHGPR